MTVPVISPLPTPVPQRSSPGTFAARGDALLAALPGFVDETNAVAAYLDAMAPPVAAFDALANFRGLWSALSGSLAMPATVSHSGQIYALTTSVVDVTAHTPGVSAAWQLVRATSEQITHGAGTVSNKFSEIDSIFYSGLSGSRNKLINGSGSVNQRSVTSVADDTYFSDRWYALHESGHVTVAHVSDPESGAISGFRLTQPDATAKRIGLAQIIERNNIRQCANAAMNLFSRVKISASTAIRFAILEHTGTADVVTSDVVNNWSSTNFTAGNFFIAGLNVIKTGTVTPGAATWGTVNDWSALGANVNNVVVFFWTEAALAQSGTLEVNRAQYEPGVVATPYEWRMNELQLCQRYYYKIATGSGYGTDFTAGLGICTSTTNIIRAVCGAHPVEMRAAPTITNWANLRAYSAAFAAITSLSHDGTTNQRLALTSTSSGGGLTANTPGAILSNSASAAVIELSSEL